MDTRLASEDAEKNKPCSLTQRISKPSEEDGQVKTKPLNIIHCEKQEHKRDLCRVIRGLFSLTHSCLTMHKQVEEKQHLPL